MSEIADGYEGVASGNVTVSEVTRPYSYADEPFIIRSITLTVEGDGAKGSFTVKGKVPELSIAEPLTLMLVRKTMRR